MTASRDTKRVTAADVARSLGLSRATVGFVLNRTPGQTIPETTRARVLAEAARLGYRPHAAAQALARGRSNVMMIVLPDWPVEFAMRLNLEEAGRLLEAAGYSLVTQARHGRDLVRPLWEALQPAVVLGMLPFSEEELAAMRTAGVPRVLPGDSGPLAWDEVPGLTGGAREQVRHLVERGHTRLGFALQDRPRLSWVQERRLEAVAAECDALGIDPPSALQVGEDAAEAGPALRTWLDAGVRGVIGYNDESAAVVLGAALRADVEVPGEIAVVGHDDTPLARLLMPAMSSVRLDQAALGRYIAETMLHAAGELDDPAALPDTRVEVVHRQTT